MLIIFFFLSTTFPPGVDGGSVPDFIYSLVFLVVCIAVDACLYDTPTATSHPLLFLWLGICLSVYWIKGFLHFFKQLIYFLWYVFFQTSTDMELDSCVFSLFLCNFFLYFNLFSLIHSVVFLHIILLNYDMVFSPPCSSL